MDEAAIQSVALTSDGTATALAHRAGLAAAVAAKHADAVDDKARFPSECFAALREINTQAFAADKMNDNARCVVTASRFALIWSPVFF